MKKPAIIFDLDGTLTDSGEGIFNCVQLALRHFGLPCEDREALRVFIGPPMRETFPKFGVREDQVEEALAIFRSRYNTVGKYENALYPGIPELLEALQSEGYSLYVATSKPEPTARDVLEKFHLTGYFQIICGADFAGLRDSKEDVLAYLLSRLSQGVQALMVGDTVYDVRGAKQFGIPAVCVSWGYGNTEEMERAGAAGIVHTPRELLDWICAWAVQES